MNCFNADPKLRKGYDSQIGLLEFNQLAVILLGLDS